MDLGAFAARATDRRRCIGVLRLALRWLGFIFASRLGAAAGCFCSGFRFCVVCVVCFALNLHMHDQIAGFDVLLQLHLDGLDHPGEGRWQFHAGLV